MRMLRTSVCLGVLLPVLKANSQSAVADSVDALVHAGLHANFSLIQERAARLSESARKDLYERNRLGPAFGYCAANYLTLGSGLGSYLQKDYGGGMFSSVMMLGGTGFIWYGWEVSHTTGDGNRRWLAPGAFRNRPAFFQLDPFRLASCVSSGLFQL